MKIFDINAYSETDFFPLGVKRIRLRALPFDISQAVSFYKAQRRTACNALGGNLLTHAVPGKDQYLVCDLPTNVTKKKSQ